MRTEITREQLQQALKESRCSCDLDTALQFPALAIALANTAISLIPTTKSTVRRPDFKRASAGDNE